MAHAEDRRDLPPTPLKKPTLPDDLFDPGPPAEVEASDDLDLLRFPEWPKAEPTPDLDFGDWFPESDGSGETRALPPATDFSCGSEFAVYTYSMESTPQKAACGPLRNHGDRGARGKERCDLIPLLPGNRQGQCFPREPKLRHPRGDAGPPDDSCPGGDSRPTDRRTPCLVFHRAGLVSRSGTR